ncbi:MAG: hypothetical protein GX638_07995, partial [Crenarchaeota archaeon]|nr:hypothetical protein [Thermoproteota archaeon]
MSRLMLISGIVIVVLLSSSLILPCFADLDSSWSKTYGGSSNERAFSLIKTQEGGYALMGTSLSYSSSGYIVAYLVNVDANGNLVWNSTYEGLGVSYPCCMIQTSDGGYAFGGYSYISEISTSLTPWFARTDSLGVLLWNKTYSELGSFISNVIETPDHGYAIVGYSSLDENTVHAYLAKMDSEGNVEWIKTYGESGDNELYAI